ncbi:hypothetical protein GCM10020000_82840 [Streptomyces olivoverticillatus]
MLVLATIAIRTDTHSRTRDLDNDAGRRAEGLGRAVFYDAGGTLHLEPVQDDELARGADVFGVLQTPPTAHPRVRHVNTSLADLPDRDDLDEIWREVRHDEEAVLYTTRSVSGREYQWAATPVWNEDTIAAMVLVGADPAQSRAAHARLVHRLALGSAGLVLVAAVVGHLLSGRAMRLALRGLEQQEQFLAEAAHELRTPLATLRLVVEASNASPGRAPEALGDAVRLVDRLG